jgi:hypothetical protein
MSINNLLKMANYFDSRYLTLVGHVQSGKTIEEINYCYSSINQYHVPVILIVRNVSADQLQIRQRFSENGIEIELLKNISIEKAAEIMQKNGVLVLLCNIFQLNKMKRVLELYTGKFHVCIDEVDFSIKSRTLASPVDRSLTLIKNKATHILGATATPFALFSTQKDLNRVRSIKPKFNYRGIDDLEIVFVESCIIRKEPDFPLCDMGAMDTIYDSFLGKSRGVILHTVVKERENQIKIQKYLANIYPELTTIVYNGDGIRVVCRRRDLSPFARRKELNQYLQLVNKYNQIVDEDLTVHYFQKYSISEVLQLLVDDHYDHSHISIISGHLASRGISFVSTDYSLHLTDQYLYTSKNTHGENLLQSLRILGCYNDNQKLTLWCSTGTWSAITAQNKIINDLVYGIDNNSNWMSKIREININRPRNPLTRPKLCNYSFKPGSKGLQGVLDFKYDELDSEI